MKKLVKLGLVAALTLTLMITVAGCGGSTAKDQGASDKSEKQKIVTGFEPTFAPFESTDEKGEFVGFDIDMIKAIGEAENIDVELKNIGFDGLIPALQGKQIDIITSGMTINDERKKQVDFSVPYYQAGLVLAVKSDNDKITKPEDLAGKTISVQIGTTGADQANEYAKQYGAKVKTFNTSDLVYMELMNGAADAVIMDKPVNDDFMIKKGQGKVKAVGDPLTGEYYGIAVAKGNTDLLNKVNDGLNKIKANGKYAEIYKKWFGVAPADFLPGEPK